jgi:hypothetical protein
MAYRKFCACQRTITKFIAFYEQQIPESVVLECYRNGVGVCYG